MDRRGDTVGQPPKDTERMARDRFLWNDKTGFPRVYGPDSNYAKAARRKAQQSERLRDRDEAADT